MIDRLMGLAAFLALTSLALRALVFVLERLP